MNAVDLLRSVMAALDEAGIPHMFVGSFASGAHGAQRSTNDIDVVIDPTPDALDRFLHHFEPPRFFVDDARAALARRDQFNVIDTTSGWKVDVIIRKDDAFNRSEFERRVRTKLLGIDAWVASAEDTVLAKLQWAAMGGSGRQVEDAAWVLSVRSSSIDDEYLDHWAVELGVVELLDRARQFANR